jgi:hypothetical protein
MTCEWPGCARLGTHVVEITFPGTPLERWSVCRAHDRVLKFQAISKRPVKAPDPPPAVKGPTLHCADCDSVLNEPINTPMEQRSPCPGCQSLGRLVKVEVAAVATAHAALTREATQAGKKGWIEKHEAGHDYTRLLEGWGERELDLDRAQNRYRERIVLYDGTTIESQAKLTDHR